MTSLTSYNAPLYGRQVLLQELLGKTEKVVPEAGWQVNHVVFARSGFTDTARRSATKLGVDLVDLEKLEHDLARVDA